MKLLLAVALVCLIAVPALGQVPCTIYDIQNGTIATGTRVQVSGVVVTAYSYDLTSSGAYTFVSEPMGGPYSGVEVYWGTAQAPIYGAAFMPGDAVNIIGVTGEYYDMTEIDISAPGDTMYICGSCATPLDIVNLDEMMTEPWEGCLVQTNCAATSNADLGYGEWEIHDVTGFGVCDDYGRIGHTPVYGEWKIYTGIVSYSYGAFKLWIRTLADIMDTEPSGVEQTSWSSIKALYQ